MGVTQPAVAEFDSQEHDPRLSTLRRYALAVGATVTHRVVIADGSQILPTQADEAEMVAECRRIRMA